MKSKALDARNILWFLSLVAVSWVALAAEAQMDSLPRSAGTQSVTNLPQAPTGPTTSTTAGGGKYCNWGFTGPKRIRCGESSYCVGSAVTSSGMTGLFCNESQCGDCDACGADNSQETMNCYTAYTLVEQGGGVVPTKPQLPQPQNTGGVPVRYQCFQWESPDQPVVCDGQTYSYRASVGCWAVTASGNSLVHLPVFCRAENGGHPQTCLEEMSPKTENCYQRLKKYLGPVAAKQMGYPAPVAPPASPSNPLAAPGTNREVDYTTGTSSHEGYR